MTRTTNARIAGFTFLVYIAAGITSMVLFTRASRGRRLPRSSHPLLSMRRTCVSPIHLYPVFG